MTFREYLSDRMERLILETVFAAAAAGFLLAAGTVAGALIGLLGGMIVQRIHKLVNI